MRAAFLYIDKAKHMEVENVAKPVCGAGDVLVKINVCAICGTDGRMYEGTKDVTRGFVPQIKGFGEGRFIIGHEIVGIIEKIGSEIRNPDYKVGDRIINNNQVELKKNK